MRFGLSCLIGLSTFCAISIASEANRPNFLVILADDLGYSDLGCYGGEIDTPNLDALAANGLRYTQFYNTARCWPTRAALMTGYYAQQVGFDTLPGVAGKGHGPRPQWARLLPEMLRSLGYRSYHSGKWHLDGGQIAGGFDRSYSLDDHDRFFSPLKHTLDDKRLAPVERGSEYYATTAIADHAIEFLREHDEKHGETPFFLYTAFTSPHFPLHAPANDIARYRDSYHIGWDAVRRARWGRIEQKLDLPARLSPLEPDVGPPYKNEETRKALGSREVWNELAWDELTDAQRAFQASKMAVHAAMVDRMDQEIGRLVDQLRAMDALENTVILFLSDNGASAELLVRGDGHAPAAFPGSADSYLCLGPGWSSAANTPFRRHKTWVHEGGVATPLIVHWPAGISERGALRHAVGHVIDVAPTLAELAGGSWPGNDADSGQPKPPGRSLAGTFGADRPVDRDKLWWLHNGNRAIRVGDWKLVAARGEAWELYDLSQDRSEMHNLAKENPEKVRELEQKWRKTTKKFQRLAKSKADDEERSPAR